jgi:hypothetical protein
LRELANAKCRQSAAGRFSPNPEGIVHSAYDPLLPAARNGGDMPQGLVLFNGGRRDEYRE